MKYYTIHVNNIDVEIIIDNERILYKLDDVFLLLEIEKINYLFTKNEKINYVHKYSEPGKEIYTSTSYLSKKGLKKIYSKSKKNNKEKIYQIIMDESLSIKNNFNNL